MRLDNERYKISYTSSFVELLSQLKCTLAISTYQAGKLIFIGASNSGKIFQIPSSFKRPMGIALHKNILAVATLNEMKIFADNPILSLSFPPNPGVYDSLFLPRATYYSGQTDLHDIGFIEDNIWAVNTKFSCLSTYDIHYSFIPKWAPPFISELKPEDRCHLNGMAIINNKPAFVTALGKTNTKEGWREKKLNGGILMNVPDGNIILDNLPMPHSPRYINEELLMLLSAQGKLISVDTKKKTYKTITQINGFVRGMAEYNNYLFVGLSKIRESNRIFKGISVDEKDNHAGIVAIYRPTGEIIGEIKYQTTVEEIYDVQVLPNITRPGLINTYDEVHELAISAPELNFWKKQKNKK